MRLEDTIKHRLFRQQFTQYSVANEVSSFAIECKGSTDKPIPLCIPSDAFAHSSLVYRRLVYSYDMVHSERSTPRALYNLILDCYYSGGHLAKIKIKDSIYYYAPGVLFNSNKEPLFYFAYEFDNTTTRRHQIPRLYLTPKLLADANTPGKPMEKFFMSTIVPFLVNNQVHTDTGYCGYTIIEIDNHVDDTIFIPQNRMVLNTPVAEINDRLNNILANNSDVISTFVGSYAR